MKLKKAVKLITKAYKILKKHGIELSQTDFDLHRKTVEFKVTSGSISCPYECIDALEEKLNLQFLGWAPLLNTEPENMLLTFWRLKK